MKLTFKCPVFDASGYAEAARNLIFGLLERGYLIRILPRDWSQLDSGLPPVQKKKLLDLCGSDSFSAGPVIQICEAQDFRLYPGRVNIGMTMLECDRLPPHWAKKCNQMDQVWTPSTFNRNTFTASGVDPEKIKVVPIGINADRFHPAVPPLSYLKTQGRFVFVSNFEWVPRKGYEFLLQAYLEEFTYEDPVALVIKTYDGSDFDPNGSKMHRLWNEMIQRSGNKQPPRLHLITHGMNYEEIPSLYTAGDCYIISTRGEGWNLPALEAMASGIPVITTNWSAHLDFVNEANGYLIQVEKLEEIPALGIPNDEIYQGSHWAVPSLPDIRRLMRYTMEHPEEVRAKGKLAREQVIRRWSTPSMIDQVIPLLRSLEG
ncbi:glycosyltransferase family 4 protein [Effusibacillus lacus]|uniref:Glycosyl transferase family 2 n=1 Tax=Effusibacillus lacus TaxID=1348429 RepID=A0A292YS17_9BACL|nr:glycosyltransferase family 4 protein [Effusibacillus lacus]TCS73528.1 glycosyltransferase involved in cell wall biosynthesis [Effusibacillus lacus]GAX91976.1 glycosyl transferase family 2 [Effusibacillus lacus]